MRLLARLSLYVLAPFLLGSIIVLLIVGFKLEDLLRQEIVSAANYSLRLRAEAIDGEVAAIRRNLQLVANSETLRRGQTSNLATQLKTWQNSILGIEGLYCVTPEGVAFNGDRHPIGVDIRDREYFAELRQGHSVLSSPVISRFSGLPVIVIGEPVFDLTGKPIGAVMATITLERITSLVRLLKPMSGGVAILIDSKGMVLTGHPNDPATSGQPSDLQRTPLTAPIAAALSAPEASIRSISLPGSEQSWLVIRTDQRNTGWRLGLAFPENEFFKLIDNIWQLGIRIILAFTLGALAAIALFNRSLLRPIAELAEAQKKLENGDYSFRTESTRRDEFGELSRSFDRMATRLNIAMREAKDTERRFRTIFENANDAIFIMDGDRFLACNPATERLFGYPREVLMNTGPVTLSATYQADGQLSQEAGRRYIDAALTGAPQRFPWIHRNAQGKLFDVEVNLQRIELDNQVFLQAVLRDTSERHRAEILEEKFRRIFEASPDYMIVARLEDGLVIETNEGFSKLTGYSSGEAVGRTIGELGLWEQPEERDRMVNLLVDKGFFQDFPMRLRRRDGIVRETSASGATFLLNRVLHYVAIVRDVTDANMTHQALLASETRLKTILEAAPTPVCINRLSDLTYISVNRAWENLYGFSAEQALGKTFMALGIRPGNTALLKEQTAALTEQGRIDSQETDFFIPGGRHVSVIYSSRVIELDGEQVLVSINTDVTRLKETEKRLKTILDAAPAIIVINRLPDFAYLEVNREFEKLFGKSIDQIAGLNPVQAGFVPEDKAAFRAQTQRLLAEGRIDNEQAAFRIPDGRVISVLYSSRVVELDGVKTVVSMSNDISQLKEVEAGLRQAQEALLESEARFSALFQSSPIPMAVILDADQDYRISQLNDAWYNTFLYKPEQVLGKTTPGIHFQVNPEDRGRLLEILLRDGEARNFESWLRRGDDSQILCLVSGRLLTIGEHRLILAAYQDITKQRENEEALRNFNSTLETHIQERTRELQVAQAELMRSEKLAALGSLVAGVAHELNTPIGNSLTVATTLIDRTEAINEMMATGIRRSALESYLADAGSGTAILARNLQRAAELIQSFKSIAVDQSNDQRRHFNLRQVIDETLTALRPSLKKKPYSIEMDIDSNITLESFPGPLEQVVVNLINNAILHGLDGRPAGTVTVRARKQDAHNVQITIHDDGCGIPAANLARIFDPFFTTKLGKGGSGLGLHIVRNIVEDVLGGSIHAASEVNKGTVMTIDIPVSAPEMKFDPAPSEI